MRKRILTITLSDLRFDARVRRQVQALSENYEVTLCGFGGGENGNYRVVRIEPTNLTFTRKLVTSFFLLTRSYSTAHNTLHAYADLLKEKLKGETFDLVIANDVETLPLAFELPGNHPVIFDAHEYAPRHFEDKLWWRIFFQPMNLWLCRKYLPKISGMMTVGQGLAREYKKHFNVDPIVVPNANSYFDLQPSPVDGNLVRMVHVGIANPSRRLELMIEMMKLLDQRFSLDMYLLVPGFASRKTRSYIDRLKAMIGDDSRVRILPPVESLKIVSTLNKYDLGVFLLPPINFNYENTLPNKLFDFIQARLAIAIGPTPEMAAIVRTYDLGVVSHTFTAESLAAALKNISAADLVRYKKNAGNAAKDFNAEKNSVVINQLVEQVLSK
jgi:glycosyltransferase involved in cell wall biosynthesis